MAYTLKTNIANKNNYGKARDVSSIKYIVLHYTANDGDTDENNGKYFKNNIVKASAHYFVDDDSITQSVPDNYVAYSVGGNKYSDCSITGGGKYYNKATNSNTLSIEICDDVKNGVVYPSVKTIENAIEFTKTKMKEYNIPKENVIRHFDVNGKKCPAYWCGNTEKNSKWKTEFWNKLSDVASTTINTAPLPSSTTLKFNKGDIVKFAGGTHYGSANASSGSVVKASKAKITAISKNAKHAYHIRAVNDKGEFISGVYGWVDASTVSAIAPTFSSYKVQVTANSLSIRKGAGTNYARVGYIKDKGIYTIIDEATGAGATKWGLLKSGEKNRNKWISLDYTKKV